MASFTTYAGLKGEFEALTLELSKVQNQLAAYDAFAKANSTANRQAVDRCVLGTQLSLILRHSTHDDLLKPELIALQIYLSIPRPTSRT